MGQFITNTACSTDLTSLAREGPEVEARSWLRAHLAQLVHSDEMTDGQYIINTWFNSKQSL